MYTNNLLVKSWKLLIISFFSFVEIISFSCQKKYGIDGAKVILIFGQSNATSNGKNLWPFFTGNPSNIWAYKASVKGFVKFDSTQYINTGLETQAAINLVKEKNFNKVFTIRVAQGALDISYWDYPDGEMWIRTSEDINNAFNWITAKGDPVTALSAIWMQGENDIAINTPQAVYQDKLQLFITHFRSLRPELQNTQFVMMKISDKQLFSKNAISIVNLSMDNIASTTKNCVVVNPDDIGATLSTDGVHYNNEGFITIANYWSKIIN